ncbi:hypothetical protein SK128_010383, partial [Halocaridina rubra]
MSLKAASTDVKDTGASLRVKESLPKPLLGRVRQEIVYECSMSLASETSRSFSISLESRKATLTCVEKCRRQPDMPGTLICRRCMTWLAVG